MIIFGFDPSDSRSVSFTSFNNFSYSLRQEIILCHLCLMFHLTRIILHRKQFTVNEIIGNLEEFYWYIPHSTISNTNVSHVSIRLSDSLRFNE